MQSAINRNVLAFRCIFGQGQTLSGQISSMITIAATLRHAGSPGLLVCGGGFKRHAVRDSWQRTVGTWNSKFKFHTLVPTFVRPDTRDLERRPRHALGDLMPTNLATCHRGRWESNRPECPSMLEMQPIAFNMSFVRLPLDCFPDSITLLLQKAYCGIRRKSTIRFQGRSHGEVFRCHSKPHYDGYENSYRVNCKLLMTAQHRDQRVTVVTFGCATSCKLCVSTSIAMK